jgi:tetratricopeptide (TPR) repeat protein
MLPPYTLKLLTGFQLTFEKAELDISGNKSRALVCALALSGPKAIDRKFLCELVWDTMPTEQGAVNLRQTLSGIKRQLGLHFETIFEVTKQTLRFRHENVAVDACLDREIDATAPGDIKILGHLSAKSRAFETWAAAQHFRLSSAAALRTNRNLAKAIDRGDQLLALELAQRLLGFEPDEPAHAQRVYELMLGLGQNFEANLFRKAHADLLEPDQGKVLELPVSAANLESTNTASPILLVGRFNVNLEDKMASHISVALSEAVVGDLAESAWLRVVAPGLTNLAAPLFGMAYEKATAPSWNYRLDGSIQSDPLSASIWLTNGADQSVIWTEKFKANTVGTLANDIVMRVASSLESIVLDAEGRRAGRGRSNAGYWDNLARARALFWRASQSANEEAQSLLENMLLEVPDDVRVLTLAAYAKLSNAWSGWDGSAASNLEQAARLSRRALQSAPDDAWSLMTMGTVLSARLDLVGAKRKLEQAVAVRPHLTAASGDLARVLVFAGQTMAGDLMASEALDASPRDPHTSLWIRTKALASWMTGRFDHAAELAELAIEKRPNWYHNSLLAAVAHVNSGSPDKARERVEIALALGNGKITLEALRSGHPFEDRLVFDRFVADLRSAGWVSV